MSNTWQNVSAVTGLLLGIAGLLGLCVKFILLPYLRTEVVQPVQNNATQGSEILEKMFELQSEFETRTHDVQMEVREAKYETLVMSRMFDGHLVWSQDEVDRMTQRIAEVERRQRAMNRREESDDER